MNHTDAEDTEEREMGEAEAWFNQGNEKLMAGDFTGAIESYDKALKIQPDYYQAWYKRGIALANLGKYEEAIASFSILVTQHPPKPDKLFLFTEAFVYSVVAGLVTSIIAWIFLKKLRS